MELKNKKILVTGGNGFLGKFVIKELEKNGVTDIFSPSSAKLDLRLQESCKKAVEDIDIVFHLAGTVGGIGFNKSKDPEDRIAEHGKLMQKWFLAKMRRPKEGLADAIRLQKKYRESGDEKLRKYYQKL